MTVMPVASILSALPLSWVACAAAPGPTATIRSPSVSTSAAARGGAPVPSISVPLVISSGSAIDRLLSDFIS